MSQKVKSIQDQQNRLTSFPNMEDLTSRWNEVEQFTKELSASLSKQLPVTPDLIRAKNKPITWVDLEPLYTTFRENDHSISIIKSMQDCPQIDSKKVIVWVHLKYQYCFEMSLRSSQLTSLY